MLVFYTIKCTTYTTKTKCQLTFSQNNLKPHLSTQHPATETKGSMWVLATSCSACCRKIAREEIPGSPRKKKASPTFHLGGYNVHRYLYSCSHLIHYFSPLAWKLIKLDLAHGYFKTPSWPVAALLSWFKSQNVCWQICWILDLELNNQQKNHRKEQSAW